MNKRVIELFLLSLICLNLGLAHALAFDLDMTVDDEIRKNYNSSKLIKDTNLKPTDEELPALPNHLKNSTNTLNTKPKVNEMKLITSGSIPISAGTVFNVVNSSKISDWQRSGSQVMFKTKSPIIKKKYTIPANTVFTGEVIESHQPQYTCNGGLVVIRIRNMQFNGVTYPVNAYVTRADGKNIFLNNIKGDRTYLKTVWKKGNWGRNIFNRMLTLTVNLGGDGSTLLFSPFPFAYGTICLGANALTSPISALFTKGGHVSIPAGSEFRIKLLDTAYIN